MDDTLWREKTIESLKNIFDNKPDVLSFSIFGSLSDDTIEKDRWSDIDAMLVVDDVALDKYYPNIEWLNSLGTILIVNQSKNEQSCTTKVIFEDFRKIDFVVATKSAIISAKPFWPKQKLIISNSDSVAKKLETFTADTFEINEKDYDLSKFSDEFWFKLFVATTKLMRNDLLISLHLCLDLYMQCLVLAMWIRDRQTGTNIHRTGSVGNELIEKMNLIIDDLSKPSILELIGRCGEEFEKLCLAWDPNFKTTYPKFKHLLDTARDEINS